MQPYQRECLYVEARCAKEDMEYEKKCYKTTYISLPCVKQPPPQEQSAATSSTIPNTQSTLISNAEYRIY